MEALVGYGSDEDNSDVEETELVDEPKDGTINECQRIVWGLPSKKVESVRRRVTDDEVLEEAVRRKEWELREAPKVPDTRDSRQRIQIAAFGSLDQDGLQGSDESDDEQIDKGASATFERVDKSCGVSELLSMLPQPKDKQNQKAATVLLPNSLRLRPIHLDRKRTHKTVQPETVKKKTEVGLKKVEDSDDDEDGCSSGDFFGLTAKTVDDLPRVTVTEMEYGPARPPPELQSSLSSQQYQEDTPHPSHAYNLANLPSGSLERPTARGTITDDQARHLIYEHEFAPWGKDIGSAPDMDSIRDVEVDAALGPNIRGNLLKQLSSRALPSPAAIAIKSQQNKKNSKDKQPGDMTAKRKHQITYLAQMAIDREEQLQEQWSQNKQMKRMSAQKYGF